jgi:glutathione S-transferase
MTVLYHYEQSVFSRRTRLSLAHKGIEVELRNAFEQAHGAEARRLFPLRTMPVLVDEGRVVGDSTAIAHYLDLAYPERPLLWPRDLEAGREALEIVTAIDLAMNTLADLGTRYFELRGDAAWSGIVREKMERAQAAIDLVAAKATRPILAGEAWGVADIWTLSTVRWISAFPGRAATSPNVANMLTLGFRLPPELVTWASAHESRPDVRAIFG